MPDVPAKTTGDQHGTDRHVLYPRLAAWLVFLAAMDLMMTWIVLAFGGSEANVLAHSVLERWGLTGMIVLKFAGISTVLVIGEFIGRRKRDTGRKLLVVAVAVSAAPVVLAFALLARFVFG